MNQLKPSNKKTRLISILERAVNECILTLWLLLICIFVQDNLDSYCGDSTISVSEAVKGTIAAKEAPVEVLEEDVDGLLPDLVRMMGRMLL